jgi:hypothetical protein
MIRKFGVALSLLDMKFQREKKQAGIMKDGRQKWALERTMGV